MRREGRACGEYSEKSAIPEAVTVRKTGIPSNATSSTDHRQGTLHKGLEWASVTKAQGMDYLVSNWVIGIGLVYVVFLLGFVLTGELGWGLLYMLLWGGVLFSPVALDRWIAIRASNARTANKPLPHSLLSRVLIRTNEAIPLKVKVSVSAMVFLVVSLSLAIWWDDTQRRQEQGQLNKKAEAVLAQAAIKRAEFEDSLRNSPQPSTSRWQRKPRA